MNYKLLMNFALETGEIMLENGAETFRVEDTISRILNTSNCQTAEAFVTPTGIFATLDHIDIDCLTYVRRIKGRTINLSKIAGANHISRSFCNGDMSLEAAMYAIEQEKAQPDYQSYMRIVATGLSSAFFALVFGGNSIDFFAALMAGVIFALLEIFLLYTGTSKFFIDLTGGFLAGVIPFFLINVVGYPCNYDLVVISSIMPMVPGVAITNGIRDILHGELISGVARIADAFIIAISIAVGVGFALLILG